MPKETPISGSCLKYLYFGRATLEACRGEGIRCDNVEHAEDFDPSEGIESDVEVVLKISDNKSFCINSTHKLSTRSSVEALEKCDTITSSSTACTAQKLRNCASKRQAC